MRTQRRLSDSERAERRERDRERLKQAAEQLLTSEGWQRWVRVRAQGGLARLSLNNQLLVALSCPDATFVAGFRAWLKLGYCVRKGEKAIRIVAPMPIKQRETRLPLGTMRRACCSRACRCLTGRRSRRSMARRRLRCSRRASR
jgi:N-terminal domain of anti-restriction factor ArdC